MLSRARDFACRALLTFPLLFPAGASALESSWADAASAKVRLLADGPVGHGAASRLRAGVEIRLAPGWHTYWRYAGDAGIPPHFDWTGSENLAAVKVRWPAPIRIRVEDDLESIGYEGTVILPLHLRPQDPAKPVRLHLKLDFGVCEKICIPATATLALEIPPGGGRSLPALDAAETRVPAQVPPGAAGKLRILGAKLERGASPHAIVDVAVPPGAPFDLFAEGPTEAWALPLPKRIESKDGRARFVIPIDGAPAGGSPTPSKLRLTLVAGAEAIETALPLD
jgi:DsbC/DsbD-like thiol-disulfide interchange protein